MHRRGVWIGIAAVAVAATLAIGQEAAKVAQAKRMKVLVLGFDGADYAVMDRLIQEGKLPNIAKLRQSGTVAPLLPTNPAQTPVSWSAWATGLNPGKTEIFDFLKRNESTYYPTFAMNEEKKKPFTVPLPASLGEVGADGVVAIGAAILALLVLLVVKLARARFAIALALSLLAGGAAFVLGGRWLRPLLPREIPYAVNNAKGETFWETAAKHGLKARVVHVPATFPARRFEGQLLAGLGVPDLRGRVGTPSYYTDDSSLAVGDNEFSLEMLRLDATRDAWDTEVFGPPNQLFFEKDKDTDGDGVDSDGDRKVVKLPMKLARDAAKHSVRITIPGAEITGAPGDSFDVAEGQWSPWITLTFPFNQIVKVKGFARFRLFSVQPLRLYLSPVNIHPSNPIVLYHSPVTQPPRYIEELYGKLGLFKTIGWAVDTWTLSSDLGDEKFFQEDVEFTVGKELEILETLTRDDDVDVYVQVFEFTDRVGHLIWRLVDPEHPRYDPDKAKKYGDLIDKSYARMDEIVGQAMERSGPNTLLLVSSDHGFTSFRRSMNYNTWLIQNGFMVVKHQGRVMTVEDLFSRNVDSFFVGVDWSQTKAYALGLGAMYVNLQGREPQGSVPPQDYEIVREQIITGLEAYVDPLTNEKPIHKVYKREEMYAGFDPGLIPDLRVANTANYRVSWQTSLGGFPGAMIQDNDKNWSGDHCSVDPSLVKGILLSNRKLTSSRPGGAEVIDIGPTILKALGVPLPANVDGKPLE